MGEKTILVVEPEAHIAWLIEVNLERAGYQVTTVDNGQDALTQINEQSFDLLAIAETLPDMTGYELDQQMRERLQDHMPPILLLVPKRVEPG